MRTYTAARCNELYSKVFRKKNNFDNHKTPSRRRYHGTIILQSLVWISGTQLLVNTVVVKTPDQVYTEAKTSGSHQFKSALNHNVSIR